MFRASIVEATARSCGQKAVGVLLWRQPKNPLVDTRGEISSQGEEAALLGLVGPGVS